MSFIIAKMMPWLIMKVIEMFALSELLLLHVALLKCPASTQITCETLCRTYGRL